MSTNLYEILEIQADATPEEIRRAYRRQALQTHPDRAPASEKALAEEKFRQVNNAYQILTDPEKRRSYDRHGVWPPPTEDPPHPPPTQDPPRYTQNNARSHPFRPNVFTFTDPFELFDSFFGRANPFHDPFPFDPSQTFPDPFAPIRFSSPLDFPDPFIPIGFSSPLDSFGPFRPSNSAFQSQAAGDGGRSASYFSSTSSPYLNRQGTGGGPWISESRSTSTINGVTTSVHERVDSLGNIYTTTTHHHRHQDYLRGRHDRHNTYRADRDYFPDYRNSHRPGA